MTSKEILEELKALATPSTKNTFLRHGAKEPFFGVKVGDLKTIQKKIKINHALAIDLYNTGNSDAMYLAGLIVDPAQMTEKDLQQWAEKAPWSMISEYTVPWTASESKHALTVAQRWIKSDEEKIACAGWNTLSSYISITPNDMLDFKALDQWLSQVVERIHSSPERVRLAMNGFIIVLGSSIPAFTETALAAAKKIGKVEVDMGDTACKIPDAAQYISSAIAKGSLQKKRKTAKC